MKSRTSYFNRFLDIIERVGNFLPHPASLFAIFALAVVVLSGIFASLDLSVSHPSTGETIEPVSLLNLEGLHRMLTRMVTNFTSFAPLGTVFVSMLGIGLAESSGLIGAALKKLVLSAPVFVPMFMILGYSPRIRAGGLSYRRLGVERGSADDVLFRAHRRFRRQVRTKGRDGFGHRVDAPLYDRFHDRVVDSADHLYPAGAPRRPRCGPLFTSIAPPVDGSVRSA